MGSWGTDINENDIYMDVEAEFLELLAEEKTPRELYEHFDLETELYQISEETHDWWFAIADLFWKIGFFDDIVFKIIEKIITSKADLKYWRECDADPDDIKERAKHLKAFLKKISKPINKPMSYDDFVAEKETTISIEEIPKRFYTKEEIEKANILWEAYLDEATFKQQQKLNWPAKLLTNSNKNTISTQTKKPCFLAGTLIHTTNGLVAIENITKDTEVYCFDEIKQTLTTQKVRETYKNQAEKHLKITTQSGEVLAVTGQHLFYQKTSQTWIKAHQLKVGMKLYNAQNDQLENITTLEIIEQTVPTFNFEVPTHHNYLVGKTGFLAHNANKFKSINDTTTRKYAFYRLLTLDTNDVAETQYIGKTTREDLNIRNSEHSQQGYRKGPKSKHYWKYKDKPQIKNINQELLEFVEMTSIQSDVWEKYYLEKYRYETGRPLKNIQNPISEKRFNALKASGKHKNICLFYI